MSTIEIPKNIKLTYFDARARAEPVRLSFAYAGIKFEDARMEFSIPPSQEWLDFKPSTPWGSLPMLEVDGKVIGQSVTIARFAAQLAGIFGDDIYEQAKYDAVVGACQEILELWGFWEFEMDAQRKEKLGKEVKERLPVFIAQLEKVLGTDDFFGGSKLCWADLQVLHTMEMYKECGLSKVFDESKTLSALIKRVQEIPQIKAYLDARTWTIY